jgi:hypothetical protein
MPGAFFNFKRQEEKMAGRIVELLKCSVLALVLLNLTWAVGCGDGAKVVTEEQTSGGADDPANVDGGGSAGRENPVESCRPNRSAGAAPPPNR